MCLKSAIDGQPPLKIILWMKKKQSKKSMRSSRKLESKMKMKKIIKEYWIIPVGVIIGLAALPAMLKGLGYMLDAYVYWWKLLL